MINTPKIIIATVILFIFTENIFSQINKLSEIQKSTEVIPFVPKKAGIAFRIDDNPTKEYYSTMAQLFDHYNNNTFGRSYHFSFALNFARTEFDSQEYIDTIKAIQSRGHEIMDHTPNHRTNYFITSFPASDYLQQNLTPINGVNQIIEQADGKRKICLEFNPIDITGLIPIGTCSVNGNILSGDFSSFEFDKDIYVYLQELGKLLYIFNINGTKTEATVDDVWQEQVNLGNYSNVTFYKLRRANRLSINGLKVLANETLKLAVLYDIDRPTTWIQPGGRHPIINMSELKLALEPLGYKAGAAFVDNVVAGVTQAFKVFNEYDPNDEKKYSIQWQDFNEDKTSQTIDAIKTKISDGIAKNTVLIGHNHFYDLGSGPYVSIADYFLRVEEILAWCNQNNIEINTYAEWADILFEKTPDPYEDVFPPLNVNYDNFTNSYNPQGVPDGYYESTHIGHGTWETDPNAPSPSNYCYRANGWYSRIFLVQNLGGIEKGEQDFEIWTKGGNHENNYIKVTFKFPSNPSYTPITFQFPANTENWTKYNLSQSTNSNKSLLINEDVSVIEVEVLSNTLFYSPVKVSGMSLKKKRQTIAADLKVNLEGVFSNGAMNISQDFRNLIQQNQPYADSPWVYTGSESFITLPENVIDWVLVELRSDSTSNYYVHSRKAGLLKNDGTIINSDGTPLTIDVGSGNYYVVIYHRNHLPIMSSVPVSFN